jgi:hypothetical protein
MRDYVAGIVALALLLVAASLATTLTLLRRRRLSAREAEHARGRTIVAELPTSDELTLFSEDPDRFYYGERAIDKALIVAARVLINGAPIAEAIARRHAGKGGRGAAAQSQPDRETRALAAGVPSPPDPANEAPLVIDDPSEGILRDRWDVAIESVTETVLVECGAIRERISQELARAVFEAVRRDIDGREAATTRSREHPRDD